MSSWTLEQIGDQTGRVVIVTGANSGIGYEAALALAAHGARVVLACRNVDKGRKALERIGREVRDAELDLIQLDLSSLAAVQQFADAIHRRYDRLDLLINNAGLMAIPQRQTEDGFEMQFGVNHLAHFALTGRLLDLLLSTPGSRVVTVSSRLHENGQIDFDDLQHEHSYSPYGAYGQSKLANLLFAYELQRRLEAAGASTLSVAAHPGYAATNLQSAGPEMSGSWLQGMVMTVANALFAQSAAMGALPTLYAATADDVNGCDYIGPTGLGGMRGAPGKVASNRLSHDVALAQRLWAVSEQLTGVTYTLPSAESRTTGAVSGS